MTAADRAADAYVWGLPLVTVHRTRTRAEGEGMVSRPGLATAADRSVVAPNHDTLYASGWFDLGAGDLVVEVGPVDRYWSVTLLDAHTHVSYVCRRLHGTAGTTVRVLLDPHTVPVDSAREVLPVATRTVWVLVRVGVDGDDDLVAARADRARIRVRQVGGPRPGPPRTARRGADVFTDLRAALAVDPPAPWHPPPPAGLTALLAGAAPEVLAAGAAEAERRLAARGSGADRHRDGWGTRSRGAAFDDPMDRAAFARVSLAGHLPAENRSYLRGHDGSAPARLRFAPGAEPPVDGFWSLSVYGPDGFLHANPLGRHSLGDRTPGLPRDPDGGLSLLVGHDRPADDRCWLPAPAGPCVLALRAYEGRPPVVDATWFPPDLEVVASATGTAP